MAREAKLKFDPNYRYELLGKEVVNEIGDIGVIVEVYPKIVVKFLFEHQEYYCSYLDDGYEFSEHKFDGNFIMLVQVNETKPVFSEDEESAIALIMKTKEVSRALAIIALLGQNN
jgi:hypothetical protein